MQTNPLHFDEKMPLNLSSDEMYLTMSPSISSSINMFIIKTRDRVTTESNRSFQISKNPAQMMIFSLVASNGLKWPLDLLQINLRMRPKTTWKGF
jgi:hypothetical protein